MLNFFRPSSPCCTGTRRYRTSPNSKRIYGPSPSDIRPVLQTTSNISCSGGTPVNKTRRWRWSDESRSRLRESYKVRTEVHPLHQWRTRNPAAFSKLVSEAISKAREEESRVMLLELLTHSQPRKLELWNPEGYQPRYRISLFSGRFFLRIPGDFPDPGSEKPGGNHTVFVAISISPSLHPCSARRSKRMEASPLNSIGIRVFGNHPITGSPFHTWARVGDRILRRILDIAHSFEDQEHFREICMRSLEAHQVKG
ncbi:hypothetical protein JB92DRAFT_464419 [Gautieria morchelliformis]|nr:hypothetical protein JB92DRAFT_464419 [Gautieria morchelliformis]